MCCAYHLMLGTGFIIFGTITRLLFSMLNVKRKQTLGNQGKPITENTPGEGEQCGPGRNVPLLSPLPKTEGNCTEQNTTAGPCHSCSIHRKTTRQ